jgi:hypothetical protein
VSVGGSGYGTTKRGVARQAHVALAVAFTGRWTVDKMRLGLCRCESPFNPVSTLRDETKTRIRDLEEQLSTTADEAQLANTGLQNMLQKQQWTLQMFLPDVQDDERHHRGCAWQHRLAVNMRAPSTETGAVRWCRILGLWSH